MPASLALQKALRALLTDSPAVTALVPAGAIVDRNAPPERFPCIVLGECQEVPAGGVAGRYLRLYSTLHLWQEEPGLTGVKAIAGAVRAALGAELPAIDDALCHDLRFTGSRFFRDADGLKAHGVVTVEAVVEELA